MLFIGKNKMSNWSEPFFLIYLQKLNIPMHIYKIIYINGLLILKLIIE